MENAGSYAPYSAPSAYRESSGLYRLICTSRLCFRAISMQSSMDISRGVSELVWACADKPTKARNNTILEALIAGEDCDIQSLSSNTAVAEGATKSIGYKRCRGRARPSRQ